MGGSEGHEGGLSHARLAPYDERSARSGQRPGEEIQESAALSLAPDQHPSRLVRHSTIPSRKCYHNRVEVVADVNRFCHSRSDICASLTATRIGEGTAWRRGQ